MARFAPRPAASQRSGLVRLLSVPRRSPGPPDPHPRLRHAARAGSLRAQAAAVEAGAQTVVAVFHADPVPGGDPLTELKLVQPLVMVRAAAPAWRLRLIGTLDLEGLTMPNGELAPGDWGEGFVDRRHPHTYFHEIVLVADPVLAEAGRLSFAAGKGFAPFGTDDPMSRPFVRYPVNHHLSQILERWVAIAAWSPGPITLEAGLFDGDEPERAGQWPRLSGRFGDSWSVRITLRPVPAVELQGSHASVASPEHRPGAGRGSHRDRHADAPDGSLRRSAASVGDDALAWDEPARRPGKPGHVIARRLLATVALLAACGGDGGTEPTTFAITPHGGQNQHGAIRAPLPEALAVLVTSSSGHPAPGQGVSWNTTDGSVDPATSTTDASGVATTAWRLGSTTGAQEVQARLASGGGPPVSFTATAGPALPAPPLVATVEVPPNYGAHDTYVRDGIAFLCAWNTGLIILDVGGGGHGGSPTSPVELGRIVTSANGVAGGPQVHNAWWFHNPVSRERRYVFVGQEGPATVGAAAQGDIHVVDVSDLTAPEEVGFFRLGPVAGSSTGTHNFWMDEQAQILYAAYYNGGVGALDVSGTLAGDLASRLIANLQPGGVGNTYVWGVQLYNGDLYASDMLSGFWQLRLDRGAGTLSIVSGGNNVPERFGADLWVAGGFGYTGTWGSVARGTNAGNVGDNEVSADGRYLLAVTERGRDEAKGLYLYRLSDPERPALVALAGVPGVANRGGGLHTGTFATIGGRRYVFAARNPGPQGAPPPALVIFDVTAVTP